MLHFYYSFVLFGFFIIPNIIETKPITHTIGATFIRVALNISGLKVVSVEEEPLININPKIITKTPTASKMKLILPKAKFSLFI